MTRQTRRRALVVAASALAGVTSPVWGPRVLRSIPAFSVRHVEVVGARFVDADQARTLASLEGVASVWDDPSSWEERVRAHPLIVNARIRRRGFNGLVLELQEVRPVAFVPVPALSPLDGDGRLLAIDPAKHALDLPILAGASVREGRVADEPSRRALAVLEELNELDSAFVGRVSELRASEEAVYLHLLSGSLAELVVLPLGDATVAFLRVESAMRECRDRGDIVSADARFRGQVVIGLREDA